MKFCEKCGKEIADGISFCPGCGCEVKEENVANPDVSPASTVKTKSNKKKLLLIIPAVVIVVIGILAIMILPHPDLKMKDFKDNGYIGALFDYGIPSRTSDDGEFIYDNCIEFYGIPAYSFMYEADESCVMLFSSDYASDVKKAITKYCDLESTGLGIFYYYSYEDLEITVSSSYTYVKVEFH